MKLKDIFLMSCCLIRTLHLNLPQTVQIIYKIKSKENPRNINNFWDFTCLYLFMSLVPNYSWARWKAKWQMNKQVSFSISLLTFMLAVIAAVSYWPVPLTEGRDVGEALVTGRVVVSVGRARVWHRGPLLLFITLLCRFLLISAQLQLLAVYKQGLVVEWLLEGREGGCKNVWDGC